MTRPRTLDAWLAYLETLHPKAIAMGLDRIAAVAQRMSIRIDCAVITVAGTNGKGSTCAMLETIYRRAGFRTGLYSSPHLIRFNERVRIDASEASDAALVAAFETVEAARAPHPRPFLQSAPSLASDGRATGAEHARRIPRRAPARGEREPDGATPLTYFEFSTLAALLLFSEAPLDVLILEVGLGGRLDAVNLIDADVAVITSIDIDHVDYLGTTREDIGREKAGIFRPAKRAVCGDPNPPQSLLDHAGAIGAPLWRIGREYGYTAEGAQWRYEGPGGARYGLPFPALRGAHQLGNAATALAAVDALRERLPVSAGAMREGLVHVELAGRFQVLPGRPAIVLDVAHNPHAARALADTLSTMGYFPRTLGVFGMLADKDINAVVSALAPRIDAWYVAPLPGPRGASSARIEAALTDRGVAERSIRAFADIGQAFDAARNDANETDRIAAFGSFLTVAAALVAAGMRR